MNQHRSVNLGIFKTNRARKLAEEYDLELYDKTAYGLIPDASGINTRLITYHDVLWIVHNLWMNHFHVDVDPPIQLCKKDYDKMREVVETRWPIPSHRPFITGARLSSL
jgi:hypothetical protein